MRHSDFVEDLSSSLFVQKSFGEEIAIQYPVYRGFQCSLVKEMKVEVGSREDWLKLAVFHYRGHKTAVAYGATQLTTPFLASVILLLLSTAESILDQTKSFIVWML